MAERTGIEWCDHTFSPWIGCTQVSPGCDHCYAKTWAERFGMVAWNGPPKRTSEATWNQVARWNAKAAAAGIRSTVFPSFCDPFDNQAEAWWRTDFWLLIRRTPNLLWLLLTKRPQNIPKMLPPDWGDGWPNVWLGTTAEDADHYRQRWIHLSAAPTRLRFLSYEPALGPIGDLDLGHVGAPEWVICGGESGPNARPMHPDWARSVRDQCAAASIPFFFKQWGEFIPGEMIDDGRPEPWRRDQDGSMSWCLDDYGKPREQLPQVLFSRVGKKRAGALLDGREHREFPP